MDDMNRRQLLRAGGVIGAVGAIVAAAPSTPWTWSPAWSVPGTGAGIDPRLVWDEECDAVVANLYARGQVGTANALLRGWHRNGQPVPDGLPPELHDFLSRAVQLPSWADRQKLDAAVSFNERRGTFLGLSYGFVSGMMSTVIPRESRAVYYSRGGSNMKDRIAKTAKLGYDVGSLNAYRPEGQMAVTAVKTRLVHSAVRHLLPQSAHWKQSSPDEKYPISQADMMVTWHSLPTTTMRNFKKWNVSVSPAESAGFLHSWQVTAHMLGIKDEYIPATWTAAESQAKQVLDPILAPTREGLALSDLLLNLGHDLDLSLLSRPVLGSITRFALGDKIADWLQIPREPLWDPLFQGSFPIYVAVREGALNLGMPKETYWTFDEILRQFVLLYMNELHLPISIDMPMFNGAH